MHLTNTLSCLVVCCLPITLSAQTVRLINSSEQGWSGGVAGKRGVRYSFVVEFSGFANEPKPDTVWVGQEPTEVIMTNNQQYANTKATRKAKAVRFEISVNTQSDDYEYSHPMPETKPKRHAPIKYKGVALLSYRNNDKQSYFEINKITTHYDHVSYP